MNPLQSLFNRGPEPINLPEMPVLNPGSSPLFGSDPKTSNQTLPYGGGSYNPAGKSTIVPENDVYARYRDPKTGDIMPPNEYALSLGNKIPKGTGQIPNYAGDAMTNPNQSANELKGRARDMTNARNDIATGTKDPYGVGNKSGIAYSPTELKAIENAYAGVYDPALNDVFSRLQDKQAEDAKIASREDRVFATNEAIRQWQATTGTKKSGSSDPKALFTQTQLNNGSSNSGLGLEIFSTLDNDIKNFYINPPMGLDDMEKKVPMYEVFNNYFGKIEAGDIKAQEVNDMIVESTLPNPVKHYFIEQLPLDAPEKEKSWKNIWGLL